MQRRDINAGDAPAPGGQYNQAVEVTGAGRTLYLSGQVGIAADGSWLGGICRRNYALPVWRSEIW
jgi:enamine deaminase RidA (YjgF/YER057c/UK114 family)